MALIDEINAKLISQLSGAKSTGPSSRSPINLQGGGGEKLSLSKGMASARDAFASSYKRLSEISGIFETVHGALKDLSSIADQMVALAEQAAKDDSNVDRGRLESDFKKLVKDFSIVLETTKKEGVDLLDKEELGKILEFAGIDANAATKLAQTFARLASSDNQIGFSYVPGTDAAAEITSSADAHSLAWESTVATGSLPSAIAVGDLNNDATLDLVTADNGTYSVLIGNGDGTFDPAVSSAAAGQASSIALGDLDGDTDLDIVLSSSASSEVQTMINNGFGSFTLQFTSAVGSGTNSIGLEDFDNDLMMDAVVTSPATNKLFFLPGLGDGNFDYGSRVQSNASGSLTDVAVGDFNNDSNIDVVSAHGGAIAGWRFMSGDGTGAFANSGSFAAGAAVTSIAAGYFDGDANLDVAIARSDNNVGVFLGNGDGTFDAQAAYAIGGSPVDLIVEDMDGDGNDDLITANKANNTISVLLGIGDGTFAAANTYSLAQNADAVGAGDFNEDGVADLAVVDDAGNQLNMYEGDTGVTYTDTASPPKNPLDNSLLSEAKALVARDQLRNFAADIKLDLQRADTIVKELEGAQLFALSGYSAATNILSRIDSFKTAQEVASSLVARITETARDPALAAHSRIDSRLAEDLLG